MTQEDVAAFIERQLQVWPLAKKNYDALMKVRRRPLKINDLEGAVQWNPARIVSTGADISKEAVNSRRCFLCKENRPKEQMAVTILEGWELLVNPYPIFPVHFTIASTEHIPQGRLPEDIVAVAERLPGMAVFFNGANAGASAPDHLHLQAVLKDELPLLRMAEKYHPVSRPGLVSSEDFGIELPFRFFSGVVAPKNPGIPTLMAGLNLGGPSENGRLNDQRFLNAFFWISEEGILRFVSVPRTSHRPACYYSEDDTKKLVSPGCIDMAGIIITPLEEDFCSLTPEDAAVIYSEVAIK